MNREIRDRWTENLRSGEFEQGDGKLRLNPETTAGKARFCCLGVLCEMHRRETGEGRWTGEGYRVAGRTDNAPLTENYSETVLPLAVVKWAGLDQQTIFGGDVKVPPQSVDGYESLASLNDSGWDFAMIADLIEDEL